MRALPRPRTEPGRNTQRRASRILSSRGIGNRGSRRLVSTVLEGSERDEVAHALGVSPLVVVPGDELDEVGRELDSGVSVEDRRVVVAGEVGRDDGVLGVAENTLHRALGRGLDGGLDLVVGRGLLEADDEVDDGDIDGGDTEGEAAVRRVVRKRRVISGVEKTYVSLPWSEGMTLPTALAAPVDEGMMLLPTARPPRQSFFDGPSTVFWVAVVECTVVISPSTMPKLSWMTFARGARQLVVHDAFEITVNLGSYFSRLTPTTNIGASAEGAEMMTFLAPPLR